jgi:hypothetical protein
LQVTGLPVAGYTPGQTYSFLIDWDDAWASVAYNIEMTDGAGRALGSFSLPPVEELAPSELCGGKAAAVIAGEERTLAILTECGAHQSTIRWTTPAAIQDATGHLIAPEAWFSGSVLVSNKDGSVLGDAVMDLSYVFGQSGQTRPAATRIEGGCNVCVPGARGRRGVVGVSFLLIAVCVLHRGRRRTVS